MLITKKKRGRPKKRGPKKKKRYISKKPKVSKRKRYDFKIISVTNGKQKEYFGKFYSLEKAYEKFRELEESNNKIIFKKRYINSGQIIESSNEYLLLQKNRDGNLGNNMLRNEYGKLIEHISSNPKWVIYDKCKQDIEETFWVYGKCPKTDRKTFQWVYDNLIIGKLENQYDIERVLTYKNKLIVKYDSGDFGIVLCKTPSESIRFYDLLKEWCQKDKQVFFIGSFDKVSDKRRELEDDLMKFTGWSKIKIQRDSTRG